MQDQYDETNIRAATRVVGGMATLGRPNADREPSTISDLTRRAAILVDRLCDVGIRLHGTADRFYGKNPEVNEKGPCEGPPYAGEAAELFRHLEEASARLSIVEYAASRLDSIA